VGPRAAGAWRPPRPPPPRRRSPRRGPPGRTRRPGARPRPEPPAGRPAPRARPAAHRTRPAPPRPAAGPATRPRAAPPRSARAGPAPPGGPAAPTRSPAVVVRRPGQRLGVVQLDPVAEGVPLPVVRIGHRAASGRVDSPVAVSQGSGTRGGGREHPAIGPDWAPRRREGATAGVRSPPVGVVARWAAQRTGCRPPAPFPG